MNQDYILDLFYSLNGDMSKINAAIEAKTKRIGARKISTFELFLKSRISRNSTTLKMSNMEISEDEAIYLSLYPALSELEVLDLRKNFLGDAGFMAIAQSSILKNLKELDLRNNQITRAGMEHFSKEATMTHLEQLDMRSNKLGKRWEEKLKESGRFPSLKMIRTV